LIESDGEEPDEAASDSEVDEEGDEGEDQDNEMAEALPSSLRPSSSPILLSSQTFLFQILFKVKGQYSHLEATLSASAWSRAEPNIIAAIHSSS
jgi:hypothetical protein